jgi:hypothetical protein
MFNSVNATTYLVLLTHVFNSSGLVGSRHQHSARVRPLLLIASIRSISLPSREKYLHMITTILSRRRQTILG